MSIDDRTAIEYLLLIKKAAASIRKKSFYKYDDIEEDVAHDAFIKLFSSGFFERDDHAGEKSYIYKTVQNCFIDRLKSLGIIRSLTKSEKELTDKKYENILSITMDEYTELSEPAADALSLGDNIHVEEVYGWIKSCFEAVYEKITNDKRKAFFHSAFWFDSEHDIPLKELAKFIGYTSSNPTQEFKRLVNKVSLCTEPNGVSVVNPQEQVQFLLEQLDLTGTLK